MTENKRFRVFKYSDCKEYGVSDDIAEYTLSRFDNHFEAEGLCELLNELDSENKELKLQLEAFKDKLCELGVSDVKLYGKRYYTGLEDWLND